MFLRSESRWIQVKQPTVFRRQLFYFFHSHQIAEVLFVPYDGTVKALAVNDAHLSNYFMISDLTWPRGGNCRSLKHVEF